MPHALDSHRGWSGQL